MNVNKDFLTSLVNNTSAPAATAYEASENKPIDVDFKPSKPQKRMALISHVKPDIYAKIEKISNKNNCSKSQVVEKILEKMLG